jgi:hypothetical protein
LHEPESAVSASASSSSSLAMAPKKKGATTAPSTSKLPSHTSAGGTGGAANPGGAGGAGGAASTGGAGGAHDTGAQLPRHSDTGAQLSRHSGDRTITMEVASKAYPRHLNALVNIVTGATPSGPVQATTLLLQHPRAEWRRAGMSKQDAHRDHRKMDAMRSSMAPRVRDNAHTTRLL